jgi:small subunit ribosomal protein S16
LIRLRLQRKGRKKRAYYHIVAADQRSPRDGRVIERLGRFDNVSEKKELTLDEERVIHWLRVGAQPSDTVRSILKGEGILYKLHLMRWGKSDEEIEEALNEWREARSSQLDSDEEAVSRKKREKALLEAEEKEYKKQLEEKAAEAARQAKLKEAEKEQKAAEAEKASKEAEQPEEEKAVAEADESAAEEKKEAKAEATEAETEAPEKKKEAEAEKVEADAEPAEKKQEAKVEAAEEDAEPAKEKKEADRKATQEKDDSVAEAPAKLSTDMNANEAIDHIKNTPLEKLEGFVPKDEDRVTVQRAWESKQSE